MNQERAAVAREKARRQHLNSAETIACYCDRCHGAQQRPRTERAHRKAQEQRRNVAGVPHASVAPNPLQAGTPRRSALGDITNSPRAGLLNSSSPHAAQPSPRVPPSSPHLWQSSPRHSPPHSRVPSRYNSPGNAPASPSQQSLHSSRPPSRHSSPGVQELAREELRDDQSDGNLSDLVLHEREAALGAHNAFFGRLLDEDEEDDNAANLGDFPDGRDDGSSDGHDDDDNFGLPNGVEPAHEQRLYDFDDDFDPGPEGDPGADDQAEDGFADFEEHELIRNCYVDVFVQKTRFHATHEAIKHQLKTDKRNLSANPTVPPDDLAKMAETIGTAEKRLGLSTSDIITTYTLCPVCKRRYDPAYINAADQSTCVNLDCDGILFTDKTLASGERRRTSSLTYPVASLIAWLRRLFSQPGTAELVQNWRTKPGDHDEMSAPVPAEEWMENLDPNRRLGDIPDGYDWRARMAGMERVVEDEGDVAYDRNTLDEPVRFVSLPYGLSLSMNTDWFQSSKEGNYSVGGVYFVINNLPRHIRFLRENICLAAVLPGPNEPGDYALNQMFEPIVQDILRLQSGVEMRVRKGDPAQYEMCMVHGDLCHHIADLIARIKLGGGAGVASELNFCLYCRTQLSSLSVPAGFVRADFLFRDPDQELENVFFWKSLENDEERQIFFEETGNKYTILHELPGWYTATRSPPDAMHLLYLGGANWILKQVIVGPNLLAPRQPNTPAPIDIYNTALEFDLWLPFSAGRLPPKIGQSNTRIKADQLKLMTKVMFIFLYLAMRDRDEISLNNVPRGTRSSTGGQHQLRRAKLLHKRRMKYFASIGQPDRAPGLAECFPSRSLPRHYKQILRFCVAVSTLDAHSIAPTVISFAQSLLETLCVEYTRMNVPLSPNFHYMIHLEESMLKTGSLYNTHVWPMERANGIVSNINHNGRGKGMLEGTMMRGWWEHASLQNLIRQFQAIPNRTATHDAIINDLLGAMRGGPEHAQQRGTLMAFVAQSRTAYARIHGIQESTRLSNQSRSFKLRDRQLYRLVVNFCNQVWPNAGIFGPGEPQQIYLPPEGAVRNFSYVEHDALRYGSFLHTSGRRSCYGYTDSQVPGQPLPVRIERVLYIEIPDHPNMRTICAIVRQFQVPQVEPAFPWGPWQRHLGAAHWAYDELSGLVAIPPAKFAGIFALIRVPMSYGQYWVTVSLNNLEREENVEDEDVGEWV